MKALAPWMIPLLLLNTLVFSGCTVVKVHAPVLTSENSDEIKLSEYYYDSDNKGASSSIFRLYKFGWRDSKAWTIQHVLDSKPAYKFHAKHIGDGFYLVQLTEFEKPSEPATLLVAKLYNNGAISILSFERRLGTATTSHILRDIRGNIRSAKDHLIFDEIAVAKGRDQIIDFIKTLRNSPEFPTKYYPTKDKALIKAVTSKATREHKERLKERKKWEEIGKEIEEDKKK